MEKDLDVNVIKATQSSLGKYIKRPPLNEKLLKKPPFRFLHDIITNVIKNTGFFDGLFDENELVSDNVKDRDSKVAFLNKIITVLSLATGKSIAAKPSKIVAGQDPDKTNELLQCIAEALDNKVSSVDAVKKYRNKEKSPNKNEKAEKKVKEDVSLPNAKKSDKKVIPKTNEKVVKLRREGTEQSITRNDKNKIKDVKTKVSKPETKASETKKPLAKKTQPQKEHQKKEKIQEVNPVLDITNEDQQENKEKLVIVNSEEISLKGDIDNKVEAIEIPLQEIKAVIESDVEIAPEKINENESSIEAINETPETKDVNPGEEEPKFTTDKIVENERKSAEKIKEISQKEVKENDKPITEVKAVRPQSVRPPSSRPGAPRLKEKNEETFASTDLLIGKINIIAENTPNDEDDEASLVVIEDQPLTGNKNIRVQSGTNQHGHLVQQILDSQKEFSQIATGKTEIEWEFDSQKAKEASTQEIEQLRSNIEALSRIANPLGKLLDHVQEDVEVMRQELQQWTEQYSQASKELAKQKSANEESLSPLISKISKLNADIEEKRDKINDLKIIIHRKTTRINDLLSSGDVQ